MHSAVVTTRLAPTDVASIEQLIESADRTRGYRPVSDQFWLDLHHPTSIETCLRFIDTDGVLIAAAIGTVHDDSWTFESVSSDDRPVALAALSSIIEAAVRLATDGGAADVTWLVQGPTAQHVHIAEANGLSVDRRLHQMRRSLPVGLPFEITTRDFDPERDIADWVTVNSRAFAWNPEQGGWTVDDVADRMREPWFDPAGFRIHERDGRMAGFCWTKVHADLDPVLGEIYVIAVDPDFHGLGLGRDLTLAGLDHLAASGIQTAMLFVDSDNVAAIRVYDRLGFVIHRTDSLFHKQFRRAS